MAHPPTADGGIASNMEGSCEYIEYAVGDSRKGVILELGVGQGPNNCSPLKHIMSQNIKRQSLGPGLILWYNLSIERGA